MSWHEHITVFTRDSAAAKPEEDSDDAVENGNGESGRARTLIVV